MTLSAEQIRAALSGCPSKPRPLNGLRPAAVLLPLSVAPTGWRLLLTERADGLTHHSGEIAFPGGGLEAGDADPLSAALRETEEEVGLSPSAIEPLGRLDDFFSIHGYHVAAFVGAFTRPGVLRPNPGEIARVIEVDLQHCADPRRWHRENWRHRGRLETVDFLQVDGHEVWGLTAAILRQFLNRVRLM